MHPEKLKFLLCSLKEMTEIIITLSRNYCGYFTSNFRSDEIKTITGNQQRIWIGILNRSLTDDIVIKTIRVRIQERSEHQTWNGKEHEKGPVENTKNGHNIMVS